MRFDAARHEEQGRKAAGLDPKGRMGHPDNISKPAPKKGTKEYGVSAIYAGNFMQDFSQFHSPMFHKTLANVPRDPIKAKRGGKSASVGAAGGKILADTLIQMIAIIEVGPELTESVVMPNMQNWKPEQHVEQPIGYGLEDALDPKSGLEGSAIPGLQMENPELLKISNSGLQQNIYNSVEWAKNHLYTASIEGPTDEARFHIGAAQHAIQDYYAHSNFIEVALNSYIGWAARHSTDKARTTKLGGVAKFANLVKANERNRKKAQSIQSRRGGGGKTRVDTLFDERAPGGRLAITTGSFGGPDLRSSVAHILLPTLPKVAAAIDKGIDRIFHLVVEDNDDSKWDDLKRKARDDRPALAVKALADGLEKAGMVLPAPTLTIEAKSLPIPVVTYPSPKIDMVDMPFTKAIDQYKLFVAGGKRLLAELETIITVIRALDADPITKQLKEEALKRVEETKKGYEKRFKEEVAKTKGTVKHEINSLIVSLVDQIAGVNVKQDSNRTIEAALASLEEVVEDVDHQSSVETRLLDEGDLVWRKDEATNKRVRRSKADVERLVGPVEEVRGRDGKPRGWRAKRALPPSHSELSKDHGPHDEKLQSDKTVAKKIDDVKPKPVPLDPKIKQPTHEREHGAGSVFFGLADALATEATRHTSHQVERMWLAADKNATVYGDKRVRGPSPGRMNEWDEIVRHDDFLREARRYAKSVSPKLPKGSKHAQMDPVKRKVVELRPALRDLLDMTDLIFSHPEDSTWWRAVFDDYINKHAGEVAEDIVHRNTTRGSRQRTMQPPVLPI